MDRRRFFTRIGMGSAGIAGGALAAHAALGPALAQHHSHSQVEGPLASATVSFGQWLAPVDRFPNLNPRLQNQHLLIPYVASIKAGGAVNFVVAGTHQIAVYAPGTETSHIDVTRTVPFTVNPMNNPALQLIDDPRNRVYRGLDPSTQPTQDRVEVVSLHEPGTYLVICAFVPHFVADNMHGFVRVLA